MKNLDSNLNAMNDMKNLILNSAQDESDTKPLTCCPECMAKICWATKTSPTHRFEKLIKFCMDNGLNNETSKYKKFMSTLIASTPN